jgi:hypothetical protein
MHSRQQSRLDPSPFIVRTVIGFRHSIAGQPPKQAASCSVRSAIVVFPEIASFILIVYENAARLLLRPQQLRQLGDVGGDARTPTVLLRGAHVGYLGQSSSAQLFAPTYVKLVPLSLSAENR